MSGQTHKIKLLDQFSCLGADCEDTCCKDWSMQCNASCQSLYQDKAPELLDALEDSDVGLIMKKDPDTGYCQRFEGGICSIHRDYGDAFLGDACHFFPRSVRSYDHERIMSASLSCPEIVRLGVVGGASWEWVSVDEARLPETMKNYAAEGLGAEAQLHVISMFQHFVREASDKPAEDVLMQLCSVGVSLQAQPLDAWAAASEFYLFKMPAMQGGAEYDVMDSYKLLQALIIIISATPRKPRERLLEVVGTIARALEAEISWDNATLHYETAPEVVVATLMSVLEQHKDMVDSIMKRWLEAQLSISGAPFSGFGENITERFQFLAVRFAITRLGILSSILAGKDAEEDMVHVVQALARALDHLAEPELFRAICEDSSWLRDGRLAGLIKMTA